MKLSFSLACAPTGQHVSQHSREMSLRPPKSPCPLLGKGGILARFYDDLKRPDLSTFQKLTNLITRRVSFRPECRPTFQGNVFRPPIPGVCLTGRYVVP